MAKTDASSRQAELKSLFYRIIGYLTFTFMCVAKMKYRAASIHRGLLEWDGKYHSSGELRGWTHAGCPVHLSWLMSSSCCLQGWGQPPSGAGIWRTLPSKAALCSPQQAGSTSSVSADWAIHPSAADSPAFRPNRSPREPLVESSSHWEQGTSSFHNDNVLVSFFLKCSTRCWSYCCAFSYINNGKKKKIKCLVRAAERSEWFLEDC